MIFVVKITFSQQLFDYQLKTKSFSYKVIPRFPQVVANYPDFLTFSKIILPPDFYSAHLGFFCKKEIQMDKTTKLPFRFRLGSVEACDKMEGKNRLTNGVNF